MSYTINDKVARLMCKSKGKHALKTKKPLVLLNTIGYVKSDKGDATCLTEMSFMMACWKENEFQNSACSKEIASFYTCVKEANAQAPGKGDRLLTKEINTLLRRFPNYSSH
ncbi:hypothetical protein DNTS_030015 [Danionella cerebrum]|uniref:Uncharacterized protein n=1 Tax=Danionella cerebrum TaxID=2873325 RepID=A0A553NRS6_9TELE|nr:hypothetical protein DNTS_030015 [Danionella translucida]